MILQALVDYYETLAEQGKIAKPGWCRAKISYALNISAAGDLIGIIPLKLSQQKGRKTVEVPQSLNMPEGVKRSSGIAAQFLWDNAGYILGLDEEGTSKRSKECFNATAAKTKKILLDAKGKKALAIKEFFAKWNPDEAADNAVLQPYLKDLPGTNLTLFVEGEGVSSDAEIAEAWENYHSSNSSENIGRCLITGKRAAIARLHPNIKGVRGAQSSGAALVSFNAPAFESYGHEQGMNASISEYAAFAYTTALNTLLSDEAHRQTFDDMTVVFWSEDADDANTDIFGSFMQAADIIEQADLKVFFQNIKAGLPFEYAGMPIKPSNKFYILGISPNAARLSIRFFLANTFGYFLTNIEEFYNDFDIVRPSYDKKKRLSMREILEETANKQSRNKMATPLLNGAFWRSVLSKSNYPAALFQNIILRVKADQDNKDKRISKVNRIKAAVIKAYLMRNEGEVIKMDLDFSRKNAAYILGRLFAVLEQVQESANPGINSTIKDRYFNSACTTPSIIFPVLLKLSNSHLKKIAADKGVVISFNKKITELLGNIDKIPVRFGLKDQGEFILGYYHQVQYRYTKKEDK